MLSTADDRTLLEVDPAQCAHSTWTCYPYPKQSLKDKDAWIRWRGRITDSNIVVQRVCNHCHREF